MRFGTKEFSLLLLVALLCAPALGQAQEVAPDQRSAAVVTGSVEELRDSRRVLLMVRRSAVVDSRGAAKTILTEAYRTDADARARYPRLFNLLAHKLNKYMQKYQGISAVRDVSEADFIVFFNLLEYRRSLGVPYPYGELFVILNDRTGVRPPRIIWKTRKSSVWAEDAIGDFLKVLKAVRAKDRRPESGRLGFDGKSASDLTDITHPFKINYPLPQNDVRKKRIDNKL